MENFVWKYLRLFLGVLAICGYMNRCCNAEQELPDVRGAIDVTLRPFDTKYFSKQQHLALHHKVKGRGLSDPFDSETRKGPLPYSPGGDTKVVYKDEEKEEISHQTKTIPNPILLRNCDLTHKDEDGVKSGGYIHNLCQGDEVEMLHEVPLYNAQRKIHYIEITFSSTGQDEEFIQEFNVYKIFKKVYDKLDETSKDAMR